MCTLRIHDRTRRTALFIAMGNVRVFSKSNPWKSSQEDLTHSGLVPQAAGVQIWVGIDSPQIRKHKIKVILPIFSPSGQSPLNSNAKLRLSSILVTFLCVLHQHTLL